MEVGGDGVCCAAKGGVREDCGLLEKVLVLLEAESPREMTEKLGRRVEPRGLRAQRGTNVKNFTEDSPGAR